MKVGCLILYFPACVGSLWQDLQSRVQGRLTCNANSMPDLNNRLSQLSSQMCQHSSSDLSMTFLRYAQSSQCRSKTDSSVSYAAAVALPQAQL